MRIPDEQIVPYLTLVTQLPLSRVTEIASDLKSQRLNPLEAKKELAVAVVGEFHGTQEALRAREYFERTVQLSEVPKDIPTMKLTSLPKDATIVDLLVKAQLVASRGEAKRLVAQGGVSLDGEPVHRLQFKVPRFRRAKGGEHHSFVLKVGKRKWLKLISRDENHQ